MNKAEEKAKSLLKYIQENPQQRFWQALRNWSKAEYIYKGKCDKKVDDIIAIDTFYLKD